MPKFDFQHGYLLCLIGQYFNCCKLGKAQSLQSEATQRSLPVVRLNLRVRVDDEGLEVRWEQRDSQVDVNPVYCVFDHS